MKAIDLFLREHAFTHCEAVAKTEIFNMADHLLNGMSDDESRMGPHGLNSFAWHFWHMARSEDWGISIVSGSTQILDQDNWERRIGVQKRGTGSEMSKTEVAELSEKINVNELWAYRNAVGRRTRTVVPELWPDRWTEALTVEDVRRAVDAGVISSDAAEGMEKFLPGKSREAGLFWWGLNHSLIHLGQATTVKNVVKSLTK